MDCKYSRGFTIVEAVISLAIITIFVSMAAPGFFDLIRSNRLTAQMNHFVAAINYARTEAVMRKQQVFICVRSKDECRGGIEWENGWLVFVDENDNARPDKSEIIHQFDPLAEGYNLRPNVNASSLKFLPSGHVRRATGGLPLMTFRLCASDAAEGNLRERSREIVINATGRMRAQRGRSGKTRC